MISKHAAEVLIWLSHGPQPRQEVNPGLAAKLIADGMVESYLGVSTYKSHKKGRRIEFVRITKAGHDAAMASQRASAEAAAASKLEVEMECSRKMASLTVHERAVVILTAKGCQWKELARLAEISHNTVQAYRHSAYRKLGVRTGYEAAVIATKAGLV